MKVRSKGEGKDSEKDKDTVTTTVATVGESGRAKARALRAESCSSAGSDEGVGEEERGGGRVRYVWYWSFVAYRASATASGVLRQRVIRGLRQRGDVDAGGVEQSSRKSGWRIDYYVGMSARRGVEHVQSKPTRHCTSHIVILRYRTTLHYITFQLHSTQPHSHSHPTPTIPYCSTKSSNSHTIFHSAPLLPHLTLAQSR